MRAHIRELTLICRNCQSIEQLFCRLRNERLHHDTDAADHFCRHIKHSTHAFQIGLAQCPRFLPCKVAVCFRNNRKNAAKRDVQCLIADRLTRGFQCCISLI
ncbi:hypothetical protein D9M69_643290 [compost metagenome]